jgi:spore photoproduct lyase
MQSYLNSSAVTVQLDAPADLADIRADAVSQPHLNLRVGTGEVGDSLELDPLFDCSRVLIEGLADLPNVTLELKTKTSFVDHLLDITAKGRTVISFSLNPPELAREEPRAAAVRERLRAAKRASDAGYRIAFHFDPIIASGEWKTPYAKLIDELGDFAVAPPAWVSLGTVRFPPSLREKMQPRSYLFDEYVPCRDGKFRYLQKRRIAVYRQMKEWIEKRLSTSVYLCMESETVWREVFGSTPENIENLVGIFDEGGDGEYEV